MTEMTDRQALLESQRAWLYVVARNLSKQQPERIEDLCQEGWVAAWRAMSTYDAERGASLRWYMRKKAKLRMLEVIMGNEAWLGREQRTRGTGKQQDAAIDPMEGEYLDAMSVGDNIDALLLAYHEGEIQAALERLTPKQREYVYRRFWLNEGVNDIKRAMSTNTSTMWANAKKTLVKELAHLAETQAV